ncbi:hypothetical protein M7I_1480 [Glarea lozoyensis 74030]|uniref:Uncharacterized protein n=1 Tax=Glarea lozoyensis (strain ATCC 74030 / MF5533) TaxID=1104152 RepID=H0EG70_GLAL7|nr:hypothetical protein M7I_1480 [Glarea lozoyensis 74030]
MRRSRYIAEIDHIEILHPINVPPKRSCFCYRLMTAEDLVA